MALSRKRQRTAEKLAPVVNGKKWPTAAYGPFSDSSSAAAGGGVPGNRLRFPGVPIRRDFCRLLRAAFSVVSLTGCYAAGSTSNHITAAPVRPSPGETAT